MITKVVIRKLKRFEEQIFDDLRGMHLVVGQNNSGKSTLLHALAIWQFCIEEFRSSDRRGDRGTRVSLSNFTPLPLPDFRLLWHDKTERRYPKTGEHDEASGKEKKKQEYLLIEIEAHWVTRDGKRQAYAIQLSYRDKEAISVIPVGGWEKFRQMDGWLGNERRDARSVFPRIVYVPPASNIEDRELYLKEGRIRALVGKGQPGSVVRNLLLRAAQREPVVSDGARPFDLLQTHIREWFGVEVPPPVDRSDIDQYVAANYVTRDGIELDWVNAGSGLLQSLIVLAFLYGFQPDVLLLDEPDAHLHVNLQRTILEFLSRQTSVQMLIATHAEEFIRRVKPEQISFLTPTGVRRVPDAEPARLALSEISNLDLLNLMARKLVIYVEGETDEECLSGWAMALRVQSEFGSLKQIWDRIAFVYLHGGDAAEMMAQADKHFRACRFLSEDAARLLVLDRNEGKWTLRIGQDPQLFVWKKRHIESYLLVPAAWERAVRLASEQQFPLARENACREVRMFFQEQSRGIQVDWIHTTDELFRDVHAKRMLFDARKARHDGYDALAARLFDAGVAVLRRDVAAAMQPNEMHEDVKSVFRAILRCVPQY